MADPYADLRALYPWLPRPACGPGWHALVEAFCERVAAALPPEEVCALVVLDISEMGGRLRIRARARGRFAVLVWALAREAEEASEVTCGQCGAPGYRTRRGGWVATLCEDHEAQGMWL